MKVYIEIEVPDNFEHRLDMQQVIETEIMADRWGWYKAVPVDENEQHP